MATMSERAHAERMASVGVLRQYLRRGVLRFPLGIALLVMVWRDLGMAVHCSFRTHLDCRSLASGCALKRDGTLCSYSMVTTSTRWSYLKVACAPMCVLGG